MATMKEDQTSEQAMPAEATLEEMRESALKHYEEASNAIHHWSSFVERAIKEYTPAIHAEPVGDPRVDVLLKGIMRFSEAKAAPQQITHHSPHLEVIVGIGDDHYAAIYLSYNAMSALSKLDNLEIYQWWRKDKLGWPIELYKNRPIGNAVRIVFQNIRKITG